MKASMTATDVSFKWIIFSISGDEMSNFDWLFLTCKLLYLKYQAQNYHDFDGNCVGKHKNT